MKAQLPMTFDAQRDEQRSKLERAQGSAAWALVLDEVRAIVRTLSPKEVVYLLDTSDTALADALNERKDANNRVRRVPAEWVMTLLVAAAPADRDRLITAINVAVGYKAPERARKLTDAEELAIWRRESARLAPGLVPQILAAIEDAS